MGIYLKNGERKEDLALYAALIIFAILFMTGLTTLRGEIIASVLLAFSSGFFAFSTLTTWRFYSGIIGKIYKALLVASLCLFVIEVSFLVGFIYSTPIHVISIFLAPINITLGVSMLLGLKYMYDFWIKPIEASKGFYKALAGGIAVSLIVVGIVLYIGKIEFFTLRYLVFLSFSIIVLAMLYYITDKLKGGRIGASWKFLLIAGLLYTIRNIIIEASIIAGIPYTETLPVELLAIYSYICAGYGMLKQRF